MDIDLSVLRSLESEKDISLDQAIKAIEDALLVAYHKSEGASSSARVEVDRKSGHVTVWAIQTGPDGTAVREYDDTPAGFGRIAATTARQVILQRLRDVEDELTFGEYAGREGDIVAGVIQQGKDPRTVLVDLGKLEAVLPPAEQVPGERYVHGERIRCYVLHVRKGHRGPSVTLSRTHPGLVKKLFALEVPEITAGEVEIVAIAREAGHRTKIAVRSHRQGVNAKGACIGPMGSRVRNVMNELHGEKIDIVDYSDEPAGFVANALSPARVSQGPRGGRRGPGGPGHRARLPAVAGDRQGRPERQAGGQAHRLAYRHQVRRGGPRRGPAALARGSGGAGARVGPASALGPATGNARLRPGPGSRLGGPRNSSAVPGVRGLLHQPQGPRRRGSRA